MKNIFFLLIFISTAAAAQQSRTRGSKGTIRDVKDSFEVYLQQPDYDVSRPTQIATYGMVKDSAVFSIYRVPGTDSIYFIRNGIVYAILDSTGGGGGGGSVDDVSNSDGTLIITPTTGSVVASLNLEKANTWNNAQTFIQKAVLSDSFSMESTATAFHTTFVNNSNLTNNRTLNLQFGNTTQTWIIPNNLTFSGNFTTTGSTASLAISYSASTTLIAPGTGSQTLVGTTATQTLTNKNLTSPTITDNVTANNIPVGSTGDMIFVHRPDSLIGQLPATTIFNDIQRDSAGYYTITGTTTDATPTSLVLIPVATGEIINVSAECTAITSDGDFGYFGSKRRPFQKNSGSGLTSGALTTVSADEYVQASVGLSTATFTITNSGATGAVIQVTGEGSTTILWKVRYRLLTIDAGL